MFDSEASKRARTLTRKLTASPTLPLLGWTKAVEALIVTPADLPRWIAYAAIVTVLWVYADTLQKAVDEAGE